MLKIFCRGEIFHGKDRKIRFTDKGSNDPGSNDTGSNEKGSNDKGSKVRQRVKRQKVKMLKIFFDFNHRKLATLLSILYMDLIC